MNRSQKDCRRRVDAVLLCVPRVSAETVVVRFLLLLCFSPHLIVFLAARTISNFLLFKLLLARRFAPFRLLRFSCGPISFCLNLFSREIHFRRETEPLPAKQGRSSGDGEGRGGLRRDSSTTEAIRARRLYCEVGNTGTPERTGCLSTRRQAGSRQHSAEKGVAWRGVA